MDHIGSRSPCLWHAPLAAMMLLAQACAQASDPNSGQQDGNSRIPDAGNSGDGSGGSSGSPSDGGVNGKVTCGTGEWLCAGECVDFNTDPKHCGNCTTVCLNGQACDQGTCVTACSGGLNRCSGSCVDLDSSTSHCGACGVACSGDENCSGGDCLCPATHDRCGGACIDTAINDDHCGTCDNVCEDPKSCVAGSCECPDGTSECDGECVDLQADDSNCGSCGNVCTRGQVCQSGTCECVSGEQLCSDGCADTRSSVDHCGACESACGTQQACLGGNCLGEHLRVQTKTGGEGGWQMVPSFWLCNQTSEPLDAGNVTIKYWFDHEDGKGSPTNTQVRVVPSGFEVSAISQPLDPAKTNADHVLTISFSAGTVAAESCSTEIRIAISTAGISHANDWSWLGLGADHPMAENPHVTGYLNGELVWGIEPPEL